MRVCGCGCVYVGVGVCVCVCVCVCVRRGSAMSDYRLFDYLSEMGLAKDRAALELTYQVLTLLALLVQTYKY